MTSSPITSRRPRLPSPRAMAAAVLALAGLVLVGQASYIHIKAIVAQVLLERAFAATVAAGRPVKPWSWADTWPVARVVLPRLGATAIVLAGATGQALAFGPGHVAGTAEPGEPGTTVYAAHRDTHFAFLRDVRIGDRIEVSTGHDARHIYRVTHTSVVAWDTFGIDPTAAAGRLVLATCWPLGSRAPGPLRYLVHAEQVGP